MADISNFVAASQVDDQNNPATEHLSFWTGTAAQYAALAPTATPAGAGYDATTLYFITA